jgi:hypothetical protein
MLTQKQIDEIRARCEAATEGPWWWPFGSEALLVEKCGYYCDEKIGHVDHEVVIGRYGGQPHYVKLKDARFIAHARTDIPALLDALEEAQREVEGLREGLKQIVDYDPAYWCAEDGTGYCDFAKFTAEKILDEGR